MLWSLKKEPGGLEDIQGCWEGDGACVMEFGDYSGSSLSCWWGDSNLCMYEAYE